MGGLVIASTSTFSHLADCIRAWLMHPFCITDLTRLYEV
jgi:hypothetical protein